MCNKFKKMSGDNCNCADIIAEMLLQHEVELKVRDDRVTELENEVRARDERICELETVS